MLIEWNKLVFRQRDIVELTMLLNVVCRLLTNAYSDVILPEVGKLCPLFSFFNLCNLSHLIQRQLNRLTQKNAR